jgi:hypothetical protein
LCKHKSVLGSSYTQKTEPGLFSGSALLSEYPEEMHCL